MAEWFHALGGRQNGPVTEAEIHELIAQGLLGPEDLVWREGMPEWMAIGTLPRFSPAAAVAPTAAPPAAAPAASAGNPYQAPASGWDTAAFAGRGGELDVGEAISLGWEAFGRSFWIGSLISFVAWLLYSASGALSIAGTIFLGYPVMAGLFLCGLIAVDEVRGSGRPLIFEDLFIAFKTHYAQTLLYSLLLLGIYLAACIVWFVPPLVLLAVLPDQPWWAVTLFGVLWIPMMLLITRLIFGYHFLLDRRCTGMDALRSSWNVTQESFWRVFGLVLLFGLLCLVGMLLLFVGVFPAMFLGCCIYGAAYRQVAGG